MEFELPLLQDIISVLEKDLPIFQVLVGPRQVGKTTTAQQLIKKLKWPSVYATADMPLPPGPEWIESQWAIARAKAKDSKDPVILVLDEIQKVAGWSEVLKRLWDTEKSQANIKLLILGSSALLLQQGLTESLAGRFYMHRFMHWSYSQCRDAYGWDLDQWLYFGGYPGAAALAKDQPMWKQYVADSLIETVLAKDVIQMQNIAKPTLLRHLFILSAAYPAQILSYNKMLGQLQDAGNTTTLSHYLKILESAFLISGLEIFSKGVIRKKGSSPKLILWNNALINALDSHNYKAFLEDFNWKGRLVENAIGAHFLTQLPSLEWDLSYWRDGKHEVDFVLSRGKDIYAIEVKSGRSQQMDGLSVFRKKYPEAKTLVIGSTGIPLEDFFSSDPLQWLS